MAIADDESFQVTLIELFPDRTAVTPVGAVGGSTTVIVTVGLNGAPQSLVTRNLYAVDTVAMRGVANVGDFLLALAAFSCAAPSR